MDPNVRDACRVLDADGLVTQKREGLPKHVQQFARPEIGLEGSDLLSIVKRGDASECKAGSASAAA